MTVLITQIEKIQKHAETASNETRFVSKIELKQAVRQGDIYLVRIQKDVSSLEQVKDTQLVPGTTQGSRHHALNPARIYKNDNEAIAGISPTALRGPVVDSPDRFEVAHPEHANLSLPAGTYQVLYQLDFQAQRRVAD